MTPNRPYLIRALYEWILDNGMSPYLLIKADNDHVDVPVEYVEDGKIIMNIVPDAVKDLQLGNEYILFNARFGGRPQQITIPVDSVLAIYARENGKGLIFPEDEKPVSEGDDDRPEERSDKPRSHLKVIK